MSETTIIPDVKSIRVKPRKDALLKERLRTLIFSKGLAEKDFYKQIGLTKQYWYFLSWGLWSPTLELKVRIAQALDSDTAVIFQDKKGENHD